MKKVLIILLLAGITTQLFAQEKKWDLSVTGGLSQPIGMYASTDIKSNSSGFAKTGYNFGLNVSRFFNKNIGVFLNFGYIKNPLDTFSYKERPIQVGNFGGSLKSTQWDVFNVGVGPVINLNVSEKFKIYVMPEIGFGTFYTPQITQSSGGGASGYVTEAGSIVNSFYYSINIGFKYFLSSRISIIIIGGYYKSECDFNTSAKYTYNGNVKGTSYTNNYTGNPIRYTNPISTINLNAGLSFAF